MRIAIVVASAVIAGCAAEPGTGDPAGTLYDLGDRYEIRALPRLGADGTSPNEVIVLGTRPDGTPATDEVVVNFSRPGAGAYTRPQLRLGALGATTHFVPCDQAIPGCLGPLTLTVALASDPTTVVATTDVELVDPIEVNPARKCLGGGNVIVLDGNDEIFDGYNASNEAEWIIDYGYAQELAFFVRPPGLEDTWHFLFNTVKLCGVMTPNRYEDAVRAQELHHLQEPADHPAMAISRYGHTCETVSGRFEVLDYQVANNNLVASMTIYFEQHCNGDTTHVLSGCVHYEEP